MFLPICRSYGAVRLYIVFRARHDRMVALVERMLALHKQHAAAKTPYAQTHLQREIEQADAMIDKLVYELYGLAEEEVGIVENSLAPRPVRLRRKRGEGKNEIEAYKPLPPRTSLTMRRGEYRYKYSITS